MGPFVSPTFPGRPIRAITAAFAHPSPHFARQINAAATSGINVSASAPALPIKRDAAAPATP
jgi:hypothetical protein